MIVITIPAKTVHPVLMVLMITRAHVYKASLDKVARQVGYRFKNVITIDN